MNNDKGFNMKKILLCFFEILFCFAYFILFEYLFLKVQCFQDFSFLFISKFRNKEIGEAIFCILFLLLPIYVIIYLFKLIEKKV